MTVYLSPLNHLPAISAESTATTWFTLKCAGHLAFFLCRRGSFHPHALVLCAGASDTNMHCALQGGPVYQQNKSPQGIHFFFAPARFYPGRSLLSILSEVKVLFFWYLLSLQRVFLPWKTAQTAQRRQSHDIFSNGRVNTPILHSLITGSHTGLLTCDIRQQLVSKHGHILPVQYSFFFLSINMNDVCVCPYARIHPGPGRDMF